MKKNGTSSSKHDDDDQPPAPAPDNSRQNPAPGARREARVDVEERTPEEAGYGYGV